MKIIFLGELNVNPERMLPVLSGNISHGIWDSCSRWGLSVRSHGYADIPNATSDDIKVADVVWSLLSPWDGLRKWIKIKKKFKNLPIIRQCQGGITPWWHKCGLREYNNHTRGNYNFSDFKKMLELSDGLMFNSEKYRWCLLDQGVKIQNVPYLITNGMAYNYDIVTQAPVKKLSEVDGNIHIGVIGRPQISPQIFINNKIHLHYHSPSFPSIPEKFSHIIHKEKYYGDVHILKSKINLKHLLKYKRETWNPCFRRYDVGLVHGLYPKNVDMYKNIDLHVPGKFNTCLAMGLPLITNIGDTALNDVIRGFDVSVYYNTTDELLLNLNDSTYMKELQENVLSCRKAFSMQVEWLKVEEFFKQIINGKQ